MRDHFEMAKNTLESGFRKIDVDQYGEDVFKEEENTSPMPADGNMSFDDKEIVNLIASGRNTDALKVLLSKPVAGAKTPGVREKAVQLMLKVLSSYKTSEIEEAVKQLNNAEHIDLLMKYIYKGFEFPQYSAALLNWHEKVYQLGGMGSIMRVLCDRKKL